MLHPSTERSAEFDIHASRFKREVIASLTDIRGTYIYEASIRDLEEKTACNDPCGYRAWLSGLFEYARVAFHLGELRILDFGCGNGEFTIMMNLMGYDATGLDVNDKAISFARILAEENGISTDRFVKGGGQRLPFEDNSFDVITMISSLEHIDDTALAALVPELARICRGIVVVQVPSAMKVSDDHTGLKFVPWMPSRFANAYIALRGRRYRYAISRSTKWDVVYRNLDEIEKLFSRHFSMLALPPSHSYPPCEEKDAVLDVKKKMKIGAVSVSLRIPIPWRRLLRAFGKRIEHFYPYYNLAFRKRCV